MAFNPFAAYYEMVLGQLVFGYWTSDTAVQDLFGTNARYKLNSHPDRIPPKCRVGGDKVENVLYRLRIGLL